MGGIASKNVWLVGEVDYRVLPGDRPWLQVSNLGLRHWTMVNHIDEWHLSGPELQLLLKPQNPPNTLWLNINNPKDIPTRQQMLNPIRRAIIAVVHAQQSLIFGSFNNAHLVHYAYAPDLYPYSCK